MILEEITTKELLRELKNRIKDLDKEIKRKEHYNKILSKQIDFRESIKKKESEIKEIQSHPIFRSLIIWLDYPDNLGRKISSHELFNELDDIAIEHQIDLFPDNSKSFGKQLYRLERDFSYFLNISRSKLRSRLTIWSFRPILNHNSLTG